MPLNPAAAVRVGSTKAGWHASKVLRLNPCPAWQFTAVVALPPADLFALPAPATVNGEGDGKGDEGGIAAPALALPVWVKVFSVDDATGDDVPVASLALSLPLKQRFAGSGSGGGGSHGGGRGSRLWPPVQALADRRFFPLDDKACKARRGGAAPSAGAAGGGGGGGGGGDYDDYDSDGGDSMGTRSGSDGEDYRSDAASSSTKAKKAAKKAWAAEFPRRHRMRACLSVTCLDPSAAGGWADAASAAMAGAGMLEAENARLRKAANRVTRDGGSTQHTYAFLKEKNDTCGLFA